MLYYWYIKMNLYIDCLSKKKIAHLPNKNKIAHLLYSSLTRMCPHAPKYYIFNFTRASHTFVGVQLIMMYNKKVCNICIRKVMQNPCSETVWAVPNTVQVH